MLRTTVFVCLLFVIVTGALFGYGAKVTLVLTTGETVTGEILAVRGETLLVSKRIWLREESLVGKLDGICVIGRGEIKDCILNGQSHVAEGIGIGLLAGMCLGIFVNFNPADNIPFNGGFDSVAMNQKMLIVFPLICAGLGAITGISTSTKDLDVTGNISKDLKYLTQFSRYKEEVPDFLGIFFDKPQARR